MSIKLALYQLVKSTLENINFSSTEKLFKYVGHYNSQETENVNNFAYDTPAAFIGLNKIEWIHTKHETPEHNLNREQDGICQLSIHFFLYDLRTDTASYEDNLILIDLCYQALIGLRSTDNINGKISSLRRIREFDDLNNNNLRQWISFYETRLQEPSIEAGKIDAQPVEFIINVEPVKTIYTLAINNTQILGYNNFHAKIKTNG